MQPPPPPLDVAQFKTLIDQAEVIIVGKVKEVREKEGILEVSVCVKDWLKGRSAGNKIVIHETYRNVQSQRITLETKNEADPPGKIERAIAGPSAYHGKYPKGARILVLLEKVEGSDRYRPLGSGTYNRHLCEFLIERDGVHTLYFRFAEDMEKYAVSGKQFVFFVKKSLQSHINRGEEDE